MARTSLARRLGVASALTVFALSAAACGGDDADKATDSSSSETTASTDPADSTDPSDSGDSGDSVEASGAVDELSAEDFYPAIMAAMQDAETMGFSIETSGGPAAMTLTGQMRYTDDNVAMKASSTGEPALQMVLVDKVIYIAGAGMPVPEGKTWFKVDLSDPNGLFGQLGKSMDPSSMFAAMQKPKEFELLGSEEVDGVQTNHYNIVMDTASYADAMELPAEMMKLMPKEIGIEMWVDKDNQPRKFHQDLEIPSPTGTGKPVKTTTEGTYYDFGDDVDIEAPPAADVADNIPGLS